MKSIEQAVIYDILKRAIGKIDTESMVDRLIPKIEHELEKSIIEILSDTDYIATCLEDSKFMKIAVKHFEQVVTKKLGVNNVK